MSSVITFTFVIPVTREERPKVPLTKDPSLIDPVLFAPAPELKEYKTPAVKPGAIINLSNNIIDAKKLTVVATKSDGLIIFGDNDENMQLPLDCSNFSTLRFRRVNSTAIKIYLNTTVFPLPPSPLIKLVPEDF